MQAVVRAYSPIQKHFTIDPRKDHAYLERKDHDDEIRNTLKDIRGRPSSANTTLLKQSRDKPSVDSFMSPLKSTKMSKETSADLRRRKIACGIESTGSAISIIGRDSKVEDESKNFFRAFINIV